MDMLYSQAEIKIIQSNHEFSKILRSTNQNRAFLTRTTFLIFSDINHSASSFNGQRNFNKLIVNQSEFSSASYRFFNNFDINQSEVSIPLVTLFVGSQPIRMHHFLKVICSSFFENLNKSSKKSIIKHLNFLELRASSYKKKKMLRAISLLMK